ncbi:hypothetical protein H0H93_004027 [Arthromyces matolae]|nr:hypothetical protein H0H93_004027 [Arthromyces matolae]
MGPPLSATPFDSNNARQPQPDVDPQILEALKSKDRLYVLKLGELMEGLINDHRNRIDLTPSTSYQRLLVHRCSAYYKLTPDNDPATKGIFVVATSESRIPTRRICDLVPPESTTAPAFKIMRRSQPDRRQIRTQSQAGSVAGDEADLSDAEPSESGSQGGRSNTTGRSNKSRMTIEQREAAYNEARSRIFMDFEEKEKEKDLSASSSSISLTSGSASGSVSGDLDEFVGSPTTESEFSGPSGPTSNREKKDSRHSGRNSSSRSSRSGHFSSGQGSSRNSRASSPSSFTYASIYEPNQTTYYDHTHHPPVAGYNPTSYMYPYSPPGMPPNAYYGSGYPYYPSYPFQSPPPHSQHSASDPSTPSSSDPYMSPPSATGVYPPHQYTWTPTMQTPPPMPHPPQMPPPGATPPPMHSPHGQYPFAPPPHPYGYPLPGYYPLPSAPVVESPQQNMYDLPRNLNGQNHASSNGRNGPGSPAGGGARNPNRHNSLGGGKGRSAPPVNQGRAPWSYGPGVGGHTTSPTETIGPRLNNRRTSNNSNSSRSSVCDEVASTASSSTTSSSSRRTYTSTASSQHPLPARPDWAVGLKPQPTLHATQSRHRDSNNNNSNSPHPVPSPVVPGPPRNMNGNGHHHSAHATVGISAQSQFTLLQSPTEFPPLSAGGTTAAQEKRAPVTSGAWSNNSSTRNIRLMSPGQQQQHHPNVINAPVHHPSINPPNSSPPYVDGVEESDHGYERPPPKSSTELFNPKLLRRLPPGKMPAAQQQSQDKGNQKESGPDGSDSPTGNASLVEQVESLTLNDAAPVDEYEQQGALVV